MSIFEQPLSAVREHQRRGFGERGNRKAPSMLERWQEDLQRAESNYQDFIQQEASIMRNSALSNEGKQAAKAELAKTAIRKLSWIGEKVANTSAALGRLRATSIDFMNRPKGIEAVQDAREREVRDSYRAKPHHDRDMAFFRAAERLDSETMRALQEAPGGPWITGDILARAETMFAERRNPVAFQNWQELDVYREYLQGIAAHAASTLLTLTLGAERAAIMTALGIEDTEAPAHV